MDANELPVGAITMGLLGGLALFLFGMEQMTDALKSVAGSGLKNVLGKLTKNRFAAAFTGMFVTAVIQSSSVTTVLVVGFISAGLMTLESSIGVIMGANVGTTITAQIVAFKVTKYALLLIFAGFMPLFLSKRHRVQQYGAMVMGLGLIFFGMGVMSDATNPLRTYEPFIELMQKMDNPFMGIAVATVFTALVQSSSATTGIVIVLAAQGFISLEAGIALAFGANVGSCATALMSAAGKPRTALQAAMVHTLFNVIGTLVWVPIIPQLAEAVRSFSPMHAEIADTTQRLAAEVPRQIANAHTTFNVINTLVFIWFTVPLAALVRRMFPEKPVTKPEIAVPKFIDEAALEAPALALDRVRLELVRLGRHVSARLEEAGPAIIDGGAEDLDAIVRGTREEQELHDAVIGYLRRISATGLSADDSSRLASLGVIASNVQHMSETLAVNYVGIGRERLFRGVRLGDETLERIRALGGMVRRAITLCLDALEGDDATAASRVIRLKPEIQRTAEEVRAHLRKRLLSDEPDREVLYRLEMQAVEVALREYYFAKKIAKQFELEAEVEQTQEISLFEMG